MQELLYIGGLFLLLWLWRDSLKVREQAIHITRHACAQINAQLLDDTVELIKVRFCRNKKGSMALCRLYNFDFTLDGELRRSGSIKMKSQYLEDIVLDIDQITIMH